MARTKLPLRPDNKPSSKGGRPTDYRPEYINRAFNFALLGACDEEMAFCFHVEPSTFYLWKREHPEFSEAINKGRQEADAIVAKSLYQRAIGYTAPDTHIAVLRDGSVVKVPTRKHYPPDPGAAKHWLAVRRKNTPYKESESWTERQEITGPGGTPLFADRLKDLTEDQIQALLLLAGEPQTEP